MASYETTEDLRPVPIRDNGEPLVDFVRAGLYFAPNHPVFPFPRVHLLREGMAARMLEAQRRLPPGWRMVVIEGFRTLQVQRMQFAANMARFEAEHPHLTAQERRAILEDFSAPADVDEVPPPHSTGGAVDVRLEYPDGSEVDLISPFTREELAGAYWDAPVCPHARDNRERLKEAMESAGITNYPGEYWHWSYGDQGWAHRGGHPFAVYGRLDYTVAQAEALQGEPADRSAPLRPWPVPLPIEAAY